MAAFGLASLFLFLPRAGEGSWVRDQVRLTLRRNPTPDAAVLGVVKTGDEVELLERYGEWNRIRTADGREGYVRAGFLQAEAPAALRLPELESELARLSRELDETTKREKQLRLTSEGIEQRDGEQRARIEQLERESRELQLDERWPFLVAGAAILAFGMAFGAMLQAISGGRRKRRRIKL